MRVNPAYIQWVGDLLIPVLGFFVWGWSLYFILLFILLDVLTKEVFHQLKSYELFKLNRALAKPWFRYSVVNTFLFISFLLLVHVAVKCVFPDVIFTDEWVKFWMYEDIGIQQGYLLLPLLAFSGYMHYKQTFLQPKLAERLTISNLWRPHLFNQSVRVFAASLGIGIANLVDLSPTVWTIISLLSIAGYQWWTMLRTKK